MSWFWQKMDTFTAGIVIALSGAGASQGQAFVAQYIQRLGGHLDEAKAQLFNVQTGLRYKLMSETVRTELEAEANARVEQLQGAYDAISGSNVFTRSFAFFSHAETTIVSGTWRDFVPALPLDATSAFYVFLGMILGFIVYEIVKLPFAAAGQKSGRRKFKRRL